MGRFFAYLILGVLTEIVVGPVCSHFGAINPERGGGFLGLLYILVHFPLFWAATHFQLSDSQLPVAEFATYPFLWAVFWFVIVRWVKRKKPANNP